MQVRNWAGQAPKSVAPYLTSEGLAGSRLHFWSLQHISLWWAGSTPCLQLSWQISHGLGGSIPSQTSLVQLQEMVFQGSLPAQCLHVLASLPDSAWSQSLSFTVEEDFLNRFNHVSLMPLKPEPHGWYCSVWLPTWNGAWPPWITFVVAFLWFCFVFHFFLFWALEIYLFIACFQTGSHYGTLAGLEFTKIPSVFSSYTPTKIAWFWVPFHIEKP